MTRLLPYLGITAVAVLLDQWIKWLVETRMVMHEQVDVLPFLALFRTYNTGVAFSMLSWISDTGLIAVSLGVIAFVLWLAVKTTPEQWFSRTGFALIIGGAVGNIIDRLPQGAVADFLDFYWREWHWPMFNVADIAITSGAVLILASSLPLRRRKEPVPDQG